MNRNRFYLIMESLEKRLITQEQANNLINKFVVGEQ